MTRYDRRYDRRCDRRWPRGERGLGLVELVIGLGITTLVLSTLGTTLVATLRNTSAAKDQQRATQQLRNGLFWLNQDTQSGVASQASIAAGDVTMAWTDYATGTAYSARFVQVGAELQRTYTVNGVPTTRVVASDLTAGGFAAVRNGNSVTYTLTVTRGTSTQSQSETSTMRVTDLPITPFATITASPTSTSTSVPTSTPTPTNTPTSTATNTATATNTPTNTAVPTSTPTSTPTPTNTPTPTSTPSGCAGDTGYLSPSANAADTGGDGNGLESNPASAYADGGGNAMNSKGDGDRHRFYNYGVSIPAGCGVTGIAVRLDYWLKNNGGVTTIDVELSGDGGTTWTAAKSDSSEPLAETTVQFGGASDLWGRAWSTTNVNNANFRVRVTMHHGASGQETYLDWIPVRVYYGPNYLVQMATGGGATGTFSATFGTTPVAGHLLVAVAGTRTNGALTAPGGWSTALNQSGSTAPNEGIFYKIAGASEPTTVTVTTAATGNGNGIHLYEFAGLTAPDATGSTTGSGTAVGSGSVTTANANDVVIAALLSQQGSNFGDASWTGGFAELSDFTQGGGGAVTLYGAGILTVGATGTYSTTATSNASGAWRGQAVAFK